MLSLNTLRTQFGVLLSVIIGGALLAFILSLKTEMGFSGNDPEVGEIAGEEISYSEFLAAYEETKLQMGGEATNYAQSIQMINNTWQSLVANHVFTPNFEDLGIAVSDAEYAAILKGTISSSILTSLFADPQSGIYNPQLLNEFLTQSIADPQISRIWSLIKKQIRFERAMNKFQSLVRNGAYANTLELNNNLVAANNKYKGQFISYKYYSVADSLVSVSNSEIKRYYKAHKQEYKQTPYRTISYVTFDIEPTEKDLQDIEAEAKSAGLEFAKAADVKAYSRDNRHASVAQTFTAAGSIKADEAKALRSRTATYGPVKQGGEWYASRIVETRNAPDSIELQNIVLNYTDTERADSILLVARKGANFTELMQKHSIAGAGEPSKVAYSNLAPDFANALQTARRGAIIKVTSGNTIQILKVVSTGKVQSHYRLATLRYPIEASQETKNSIHNAASLFSVEAGKTKNSFDEVANAKSIAPSSTDIMHGSREMDDLSGSLEVIRWANKAKVGDVSDIIKLDDCYVVAKLTAINDDEYKPLKSVEASIKSKLLQDKKFEIIKAKMVGETLEEIAKNSGQKVENFEDAQVSSYYIRNIGAEPRVAGALSTVGEEQKGKVLPIVKGTSGAYVLVVNEISTNEEKQTLEAERVKAQAQAESMASSRAMFAIQNAAEVKDNTVDFF